MTPRIRSFLAIAVPLLITLIGSSALAKFFSEPAFAQSWSVEAKAIGLFAIAWIALAGLGLFADIWAGHVDPEGIGRDRQPFARLVDNAATIASIAFVAPAAAFGKEVPLWPILVVIALCAVLTIGRSMHALRQIKSENQ